MWLFKTVRALQAYLAAQVKEGKKIGFVPTMGALHQGHLSLIAQAQTQHDITLCSIFVNPLQFNDPKDLEKYPRPIERDIELLTDAGCDVFFLPSVEEIYPPNLPPLHFDFKGLDARMEGQHRPGHFQGMVRVVHRLLDLIKPHTLFLGQKDFQQYTIVAELIRQLHLPYALVCVPTVREADGLAMSSRNVRLSPQGRAKAPQLYQTMLAFKAECSSTSPLAALQTKYIQRLQNQGFEVDYFEVVDGHSLQALETLSQSSFPVLCTTVRLDGVRLLDNLML
jgi:pantoate--beta-alanine ligase